MYTLQISGGECREHLDLLDALEAGKKQDRPFAVLRESDGACMASRGRAKFMSLTEIKKMRDSEAEAVLIAMTKEDDEGEGDCETRKSKQRKSPYKHAVAT